jgi:hypothetical protein
MNELERLLVACIEHDEQRQGVRVRPGSLAVVADWVEEHGAGGEAGAEVADSVRLAVESNLESILLSQDHTACLGADPQGNDVLVVLRSRGRGKNRVSRIDLPGEAPVCAGIFPFPTGQEDPEAVIAPAATMARWHAVVALLGYSPMRLLACCAAEATSTPTT